MRRSLVWALAATIGLSLVAWWTRDRAPALVVALEPRAQEHERALQLATQPVDPERRFVPPLPAELPAFNLEAAARDILTARELAQPQVAVPKAPVATTVAAAVTDAPRPQAPALSLRYAGSLLAPDGRRIVYLARGNASFEVAEGDRLDEGYVVEAIAEDGISLVYPPLGTKLTVVITPAQPQ